MRSREEQIVDMVDATGEAVLRGRSDYSMELYLKWIDQELARAEQRGRELERAEMGRHLRSALDAQIATYMMDGTNPDAPAWVWFGDCDRQEVSLGRWNKHPSQALYIRSDLIRDAMNAENGQ